MNHCSSPCFSGYRSCLSLLLGLLGSSVRATVLLLLMVALIIIIFLLLVAVNSSLGRCGGRTCRHSFLMMLLGQNLQYTHSGPVPL